MNLQWNRSEDGFASTKCGRFSVIPQDTWKRNPQYTLIDNHSGEELRFFKRQQCAKNYAYDIANGKTPIEMAMEGDLIKEIGHHGFDLECQKVINSIEDVKCLTSRKLLLPCDTRIDKSKWFRVRELRYRKYVIIKPNGWLIIESERSIDG